jgi:hypothetical protein
MNEVDALRAEMHDQYCVGTRGREVHVMLNGKIVRRFCGRDANARAIGYALAMMENRINTH